MPGWGFVHVQDDVNLHNLCLFEDSFSLDAARISLCAWTEGQHRTL